MTIVAVYRFIYLMLSKQIERAFYFGLCNICIVQYWEWPINNLSDIITLYTYITNLAV